uniref:Reverse transcriptase domain-containing protein n=1 Tax=Nelumbo nucifera TaxID=4432 RepID=A0A822YVC4_NELNU|nr:TPA_asm: hypothetical protein HUJ06_006161 [Nelumbo nucifera]
MCLCEEQNDFHFLKNQKSGKTFYMAIKINLNKAYDRLEWPYIIKVLDKLGINSHWQGLIQSCISSVEFAFKINGTQRGKVKPCRGIRQGDPLPPYIFILAVQALSLIIQDSVQNGRLHPLRFKRSGMSISHMFYTDDCLLFLKANIQNALQIKKKTRNTLKSWGNLLT